MLPGDKPKTQGINTCQTNTALISWWKDRWQSKLSQSCISYFPSASEKQRPGEKTPKVHQINYGGTQCIQSVHMHYTFKSRCINCTYKARVTCSPYCTVTFLLHPSYAPLTPTVTTYLYQQPHHHSNTQLLQQPAAVLLSTKLTSQKRDSIGTP